MKRSEMLELIKGLFDIAPKFPNETNAENLLATLEDKGMQPPARMFKNWHPRDVGGMYANTWEEEDGTES